MYVCILYVLYLQTVFGELVPLQSNCDVYGLSRFIVHRMLASQDIAAQFAHPTVPHLYCEGMPQTTYTTMNVILI